MRYKTVSRALNASKLKTASRSYSNLFSTDPSSWLTPIKLGGVIITSSPVFYYTYEHLRFKSLSNKVEKWQHENKKEIFSKAKPYVNLTAVMRLLPITSAKEMEEINHLQEKIETAVLKGNELQEKLEGSFVLKLLNRYLPSFNNISPWTDTISDNKSDVEEHQKHLVNLRYLSFYHESARRHEYGAANYYMKKLLTQLNWSLVINSEEIKDSDKDSGKRFSSLFNLQPNELQARLYNFAAKSERAVDEIPTKSNSDSDKPAAKPEHPSTECTVEPSKCTQAPDKCAQAPKKNMEHFKMSEKYYDEALTLLPNNEYLEQGRLALHGDFAWKKDCTKRIMRLLNKNERERYEILFNKTEHSLGYADLSWALIRMVKGLEITNAEKKELLGEAIEYANTAIKISENNKDDKQQSKNSSVNAYTFYAIAQLEMNQISPDNERLIKALGKLDAGLKQKIGNNHPALLRRRFMVLDKLQDKRSGEALLVAYAELKYRILYIHDRKSKLYEKWLNELPTDVEQLSLTSEQKSVFDVLKQERFPTPGEISPQSYHKWYDSRFDDNQLPKSRTHLLNPLNLNACLTPYVAARLSKLAYSSKHKGTFVGSNHWETVMTSAKMYPTWNYESGYLGAAYKNTLTGQWVISHGGTDLIEIQDILTDFKLGTAKEPVDIPQLQHAKEFTEAVMNEIKLDMKKSLHPASFIVYHTGHSLGGFIASYLACYIPQDEVSQRAITFDCPSSYYQIDETQRVPIEELPVINYLTRPTIINGGTGRHLGISYQISLSLNNPEYSPSSDMLWKLPLYAILSNYIPSVFAKWITNKADITKNILARTLAAHNLDRIFKAFNPNSDTIFSHREKARYIQKWIESRKDWRRFEGGIQKMCTLKCDLSLVDAPENRRGELANLGIVTKPIFKEKDGQKHPVEIIEMKHLEPLLQNLIKSYDKEADLTVTKRMKTIKGYVSPMIFDFISYNKENNQIEVSHPFSGWELLLYLRQQIEFAAHADPTTRPPSKQEGESSSNNSNRFYSTHQKGKSKAPIASQDSDPDNSNQNPKVN